MHTAAVVLAGTGQKPRPPHPQELTQPWEEGSRTNGHFRMSVCPPQCPGSCWHHAALNLNAGTWCWVFWNTPTHAKWGTDVTFIL